VAKTKYDENTFPLLAGGWAREGLTDEQIAHNLGISKDTYYRYIKKYPEFSDSIKRGKGPVDFEVENALLKRALGYSYEEDHNEIKTESIKVGKQQNTAMKTFKTKRVVVKHVPPDVAACIFWLKNRRRKHWREKVEDFGSNDNIETRMKEFASLIMQDDTK